MNESLIKQSENQLSLFGSAQMDPALFLSDESGESPEFTGARLFSARPETYKAIVALSAEGLGAIRIGKILHVSPNTVLAVRAREPEKLDIEKNRVATLSRAAARMCVEAIIEMLANPEDVKKLSLKELGIVHGILIEKSELLSGSPTARLQTVSTPAGVEVVEYLRWLRSEYQRRMGLGAGKEEQRADEDMTGATPAVIPGPRPVIAPGAQEAEIIEDPEARAKEPDLVATRGAESDRADAPPISKRPDSIDQNEGGKTGADLISINNLEGVNSSV